MEHIKLHSLYGAKCTRMGKREKKNVEILDENEHFIAFTQFIY